jgi:hypothetical protein
MKLTDLYEAHKFYDSVPKIQKWLDDLGIIEYTIHPDLTVDILSVEEIQLAVKYLPFRFGIVTDNFIVRAGILSLEGSPHTVGRKCIINAKTLTSLAGCPQKIGDDVMITDMRKLKNFVGGPVTVGGDYNFYSAEGLTSLKGLPQSVTNGRLLGNIGHNRPIPLLDVFSIKHIALEDLSIIGDNPDFKFAWRIIRKYITQPYGNRRVIECQSELIDAGLEDWAGLGDD